MPQDDFNIYDYELGRNISLEEFFYDETPEEIEYYIDLKIHQIINELHSNSPYQTVKDTILDSEVYVSEEFYINLLNSSLNDDELYKLIYTYSMEHSYETK